MQYLSLDYLIIYAFLAITLFIGLRAGRGIKDIREYAIANKTFGTGALLLSFLAANIASASVLNVASIVFSDGIIMSIALLGVAFSHLSRSLWIRPIAKFDHCLTMGDLVKSSYGPSSGIIAGILGCLNVTCLAGMELLGMGLFCEHLLGVKAMWVVIIGGILIATYSSYGGIKSVTITDIFQFIILIVVVPFIASMAIHKVGGLKELFLRAPQEKFIVIGHQKFSYYLTLFIMWSIFQMGIVDPSLIQRMLMAKTGKQLQNQFLLAAAFEPWFQLTVMCIGLAGIILYPTAEGIDIVPRMIQDFMPIGIKGIVVVGMMALAMSSISSYVHACGLTFVHDVVKPICDRRKITINELSWARYATIVLSIVAITIGLTGSDLFGLVLDSIAFTEPILLFPLLAGILGLKGDRVAFYAAGGIAVATLLVGKFLLPQENAFFALPISIIANGIAFLGIHAIRNKGFALVNRAQGTEAIWRPHQKAF
jgi:Na+/proline symporter